MNAKWNIAVVGGTGVVGKELLGMLAESGHPSEKLSVFGSERSAGSELEYGEDSLEVEKTESDSFRGMNVVFLATPPDVSRTLAAAAQGAGAWVVDLSSAFRLDPKVPLVETLSVKAPTQGRIVSVVSPLTALTSRLFEALRAQGVAEASLTALFAASGNGMSGVRELERQTADLLSGRDAEAHAFPHRLGFNLIPEVGPFADNGQSEVEASLTAELGRLAQGRYELPAVSVTSLWVPTFYGTYVSGTLRLRGGATLETVRTALKVPGLKLLDSPAEHVYPLPQLVVGDSDVHVGRLRLSPSSPGWLSFVAAIDNAGYAAKAAIAAASTFPA
jgi:aspartate-semialdehyde dehydrogenase